MSDLATPVDALVHRTRSAVAGLSRRAFNFEYDRLENRTALAFYNSIVKQFPERALSAQTEKLVAAYARDVFGAPTYAPWLRVYTAFRGAFLEGWLPDTFWKRMVRPTLDGQRSLALAKTLSKRLFGSKLFPDLACRVRDTWLDSDNTPVTRNAARELVFAEPGRGNPEA